MCDVLEVQAASNNTIKGGLTGDPTDRQALVDIVTAGLASSSPTALISDNIAAPAATPTEAPASAQDTAAAAAAAAAGPGDAGIAGSEGALWEGPPPAVLPIAPGAALPSGGAEGLLLYQPGLRVEEFQAWHICAQAGQKAIDMVMDPGPGLLLVTGGNGHVSVKAGVVMDEAAVDEAELHPGTALFIPAGTSLSFSGSSSTAALNAWITTANSRLFSSSSTAAAAPAAAAAAAAAGSGANTAAAGGIEVGDAAGKTGAGSGGVVQGSGSGLEPGVGFTAAEQVAAAVMAGAAGSSCAVNVQEAAAAGGDAGQAAMETD
uniref:Uncharacterized protein n=1 Tax=Tetradesmus obliquus TaxID=3088 RepID=A0A383W6H3_TETOB|eukprot:jgi/Sobl393_1/10583/SZX72286.1